MSISQDDSIIMDGMNEAPKLTDTKSSEFGTSPAHRKNLSIGTPSLSATKTAIEDGAVLGRLLGKIKSRAQLPKALRMYEQLRKSRGDAIVRETFKQASHPALTAISILARRSLH